MENLRATIKKNEKIVGLIASTFSIIMFFSLFEILTSNLRGESNIYIQPIATALNGLFWCTYALGRRDNFILIPNFLGLVLGIATAISAFI